MYEERMFSHEREEERADMGVAADSGRSDYSHETTNGTEVVSRPYTVYSVVTDLARLRGKSTSTPFIMARSVRISRDTRHKNVSDSRYDSSCRGMTLIRP